MAAFKAAKNRGTICLSTGTGKSKVALDFIKETPDIAEILITSPRTNLKENWRRELIKWNFKELSGDMWMHNNTIYHIIIENVQTVYKWWNKSFDFIIADEIHTMMTPEYSKVFFHIKCNNVMGLTATHDINDTNGKSVMYRKHCPIIYEYYDSADDGIINKTRFFIVDHCLSDYDKVMVGPKNKQFLQGEKQAYEYLTEQIKKGQEGMLAQGSEDWFADAANWFWKGYGDQEEEYDKYILENPKTTLTIENFVKARKLAGMKYLNAIKFRKNFLLTLPSSARIANKIKSGVLKALPEAKILLFSELTAQADRLTKHTVHSHNSDTVNAERIRQFDDGLIHELGSCQSLTLGLNLKGATHAIMESYISSMTRSKQKKGRLDRLATDEVADMWIIRILETQSATWFEKMVRGFDLSNAMYIDSKFILNNDFDYGRSAITNHK